MFGRNRFAPWNRNFQIAMAINLVAVALMLYATFYVFTIQPDRIVRLLMIAATLGVWKISDHFSRDFIDKGASRRFGKLVEIDAAGALQATLPEGWTLTKEVIMDGNGDIDIRVTTASNTIIDIDAKSKTYLKFDHAGDVNVVKDQKSSGAIYRMKGCLSIGRADVGIFWSPRSRISDTQLSSRDERIYIVNGSPAHLVSMIQDLERNKIGLVREISAYINDPAEKKSLMALGLKYNGKGAWVVKCTDAFFKEKIEPRIKLLKQNGPLVERI